MSALAREATQHLAAVKEAPSRVAALRYLLSLFEDAEDDRLALRALAVDGEQHGFTFGDLRALVEVADAACNVRYWEPSVTARDNFDAGYDAGRLAAADLVATELDRLDAR